MKRTLREILADSQVASVSIAVFLLWGFDITLRSLWKLGIFLFTTGIPYHWSTLTLIDRMNLIGALYLLYGAIVCFAAAWGLSRWVHGERPFRGLILSSRKLMGRKHA